MSLIDELIITAKAGKGGDGVVRWLHEKGKEFGGPSGGDGGNGGNIVFRAVRDLQVLRRYRGRGTFRAKDGEPGMGKEMAGRNGEDAVIDVPVGAVVTRKSTGESFEILEEGQTAIALHGGRGGVGNVHFKASTNQYPTESTPGKAGEVDTLKVELKIIADIGLIGLPNAGKSSLLNSLTRAKAKVGAYAFTTLEPNLGVYHSYIIADIPGLIEGAAEGKGLGHAFLRHVARTRVLLHCISSEVEDPVATYNLVRDELKKSDPELLKKKEIILLTKTDLIDDEEKERRVQALAGLSSTVLSVTILDDAQVKELGDALVEILRESHTSATLST